MNAASVLAIDIGTSSVRTALFDLHARRQISSTAQQIYPVRYTSDGGAELEPVTLRNAVHRCIRQTLRHRHGDILAVGVSCFWHSLIGTDTKGKPVTPIYTWADSRCWQQARQLRSEFSERRYHARTGCMLRAQYWPAKLRWLKKVRATRWLSPAEWLTGAPHMSFSMASGTGLFDLARGDWIDWAPRTNLLPVSDAPFQSSVFPALADVPWFPAIGDGAAGNLGSDATRPGIAAINFGTSAAVRMVSQTGNAPFGLFRYRVDNKRLLIGGAISNAGNLWDWCRRELQTRKVTGKSAHELTVLPFWVGERAPTWPEDLRGAITGLTLSTTADDIFQAVTNAAFYRLADIAKMLPAKKFVVSGGLTKSPTDLQRLVDVLGRKVTVCTEPEASLRGAAVFALEKLGVEVPPLPAGRVLKPRRQLTALHAEARRRQAQLERRYGNCNCFTDACRLPISC